MRSGIPATWMRGGTSKGLYLHASHLPAERATRDALLLSLMGSPDPRQIDGIGGAHPLTSKVAVLSPPSVANADIDYLFLQVSVDKSQVSDTQNCGNILAGVAPWAIEHGFVTARSKTTDVRIHMVNTGAIAVARVLTPDGKITYAGDARIDGVPGTAAPILIEFVDTAGSTCGALLPTGNIVDDVDGVAVTCIDNGMPVVIMNAAELGKTGDESPRDLETDVALKAHVERIRLAIGPRMNLGDVTAKTVPKMCLVSPPRGAGTINTRTFIPHRVHETVGVLGAVSIATACLLPGSIAAHVAKLEARTGNIAVEVEHPTGFFTINVDVSLGANGVEVRRASLLRTARKLMEGVVFASERAGCTT